MKSTLGEKMKGWRAIFTLASFLTLFLAGSALAGGTLRVASMGEPASLDPHKVSGTWENYVVGDMFIGLTTENPKAEAGSRCCRVLDNFRRRQNLYVQTTREYLVRWHPIDRQRICLLHAAHPAARNSRRICLPALHHPGR